MMITIGSQPCGNGQSPDSGPGNRHDSRRLQPSGKFPFPGGGASGGSDVYRIAPDGSPSRIWTSHEDIVYALAFDSHDHLLAGTGNRGHVFAISTGRTSFPIC